MINVLGGPIELTWWPGEAATKSAVGWRQTPSAPSLCMRPMIKQYVPVTLYSFAPHRLVLSTAGGN